MLPPVALGCSEFHSVGGLLFKVDTFQMVKRQDFTFVVEVHVHTHFIIWMCHNQTYMHGCEIKCTIINTKIVSAISNDNLF